MTAITALRLAIRFLNRVPNFDTGITRNNLWMEAMSIWPVNDSTLSSYDFIRELEDVVSKEERRLKALEEIRKQADRSIGKETT